MNSDAETIRQFNDAFIEAFNAHDLDTLNNGHTEDAVLMPPDAEPIVGRAAIQEADRQLMEVLHDVSNIVEDVKVYGDVAVQRGTYKLSRSLDTKNVTIHGSFMDVLQRQPEGRWRYSHSMWNIDRAS